MNVEFTLDNNTSIFTEEVVWVCGLRYTTWIRTKDNTEYMIEDGIVTVNGHEVKRYAFISWRMINIT